MSNGPPRRPWVEVEKARAQTDGRMAATLPLMCRRKTEIAVTAGGSAEFNDNEVRG